MQNGPALPSPRPRPRPWALAALLLGPLAAAQAAPRAGAAPAPDAAPGPRPPAPSAAPRPRASASAPGARAPASAAPSGPRPATSAPASRFAADPPPSMTRRKWVYDVRLQRGQLSAAPPAPLDRGRPLATPRFVGRYAIELFVGNVLLDRVRFNLPLVDGGSVAADDAAPPFEGKLSTHRAVEVPDLERATRAELIDSATGRRQRLVWPPVDGAPKASASASAPPRPAR